MPWYVEEMSTMGRFRPTVYRVNKPTEKGVGGLKKRKFRKPPVEITEEQARMPISELEKLMNALEEVGPTHKEDPLDQWASELLAALDDEHLAALRRALGG